MSDELVEELFELLRLAERAANRLGMSEGDTPRMHQAAEVTWFHEAVSAGRFRLARLAVKDAARQ